MTRVKSVCAFFLAFGISFAIAAQSNAQVISSPYDDVERRLLQRSPESGGDDSYKERVRSSLEEEKRLRRVERLERVMAVEGPEFSEEKYRSYRIKFATGLTLTVLGGISLISGMLYGMATFFEALFKDWGDHSDEEDHYSRLFGQRRIALHSMVWGGLLGVVIGAPTMVKGLMGRNRQKLLRQKDRILSPPPGVSVKVSFDPSTNSGGLSLSATF